MPRLTTEQIKHLDQIMDERFAREMAEINAIAARSRDERRQGMLAGASIDWLDKALTDVALEADYAVVRQDVEDVRDIIAARRRMAAGTYGTCIDCGVVIMHARLLAYPTAKRCIECQRVHEQGKLADAGRRMA